jgi:hypothetical protein
MINEVLTIFFFAVTGIIAIAISARSAKRLFGKSYRYWQPDSRLDVLDYPPIRSADIVGGELGPPFYAAFLLKWRAVTAGSAKLRIIGGPTVVIEGNRYARYIACQNMDPEGTEWLHAHPVLDHWFFDDSCQVQLFIKKRWRNGQEFRDLNEVHYIVIEGGRKVLLVEDGHGSSHAQGGTIFIDNPTEQQMYANKFEDQLEDEFCWELMKSEFTGDGEKARANRRELFRQILFQPEGSPSESHQHASSVS